MKGVWLTLMSQAFQQHRQPEPRTCRRRPGDWKARCVNGHSCLICRFKAKCRRADQVLWDKKVWVPSSPSFPSWHLSTACAPSASVTVCPDGWQAL